jgi:hypothetical protein
VCDEAHHLAGPEGKSTAAVLRPGFLAARRFLFLTATADLNLRVFHPEVTSDQVADYLAGP